VALFFTIASGQGASGAGYLGDLTARALVLQVPSMANPGATRLEFAETGSAGGSAGPFAPVWPTGAGSAFVWAGPGPGYGMPVAYAPSPWLRVAVVNSVADTASYALHALIR
jgi:hypothetical protein